MAGDYTRFTYNPLEDHAGVLMQQGRVQLDADWNELVEIFDRRWRAETIDIIGRCVVPKETPDGFKIAISGSTLTIGRGRLYAHGMLAENHGTGAPQFDRVLEEMRGPNPTPYANQPYYPNPAPLPPATGGGPHLVYADVWRREVTALEDPDLVEKAVGMDTATRLQTVWQVRVLANAGNITCSTPDEQIPGWLNIIRPSAGRLTTAAVGVPSTSDPCTIPPNGGYRGTENRLYRVEVHTKGAPGTATFKWSRDNGSVATTVTGINAGLDQLSVVRIGRDAVLRFNSDDWVEVTDDWHELNGLPGVMRKVKSVDEVNLTITLTAALPAGEFNAADANRHTRVRRWDQKGIVRGPGGNTIADVDATGGVIPVPAAPNTAIVLEDGVQVTFGTDGSGGEIHSLDFWVFAARTADASVEILTQAPPRGIHHHYCKLALVTFPSTVVDCRTLWPPEFGGAGCDCNACVSAESHNNGTFTIQMGIDKVKATGGKVCLGAGIFNLGESAVRVEDARSVRFEGRGFMTMLLFAAPGPAVIVERSVGIEISRLTVLSAHPARNDNSLDASVALRSSHLVTIERCLLFDLNPRDASAGGAITLEGALFAITIRDNFVSGNAGVGTITTMSPQQTTNQPVRYVLTWNLTIEDNFFWCQTMGVALTLLALHAGKTSIRGNAFYQCASAGIVAGGLVLDEMLPGSELDIQSNTMGVRGSGAIVATRATRVHNNDIGALAENQGAAGVLFLNALDRRGPDACQVIGNRIVRMRDGVLFSGRAGTVLIKQNFIDRALRGGVLGNEGSSLDELVIENNQIRNVAAEINAPGVAVAGIHVQRADRVVIVGNSISGVGLQGVQNAVRAGVRVMFCGSVRVSGNEIVDIGPSAEFTGTEAAGIDVLPGFLRAEISENVVRRSQTFTPNSIVRAPWWALRIGRIRGEQNVLTTLALSQTAFFLTLAGSTAPVIPGIFVSVGTKAFFLPKTQISTAVRGNLFEGFGGAPIVDINQDGACTLGENHCFLLNVPDAAGAASGPVVRTTAGAIVAAQNYVVGPRAGAVVLLNTAQGPFTVLGNITSAQIFVNNTVLGAPWAPLNVIGV